MVGAYSHWFSSLADALRDQLLSDAWGGLPFQVSFLCSSLSPLAFLPVAAHTDQLIKLDLAASSRIWRRLFCLLSLMDPIPNAHARAVKRRLKIVLVKKTAFVADRIIITLRESLQYDF